jgi:hypothetical protein
MVLWFVCALWGLQVEFDAGNDALVCLVAILGAIFTSIMTYFFYISYDIKAWMSTGPIELHTTNELPSCRINRALEANMRPEETKAVATARYNIHQT